jgi:hypothetical protein
MTTLIASGNVTKLCTEISLASCRITANAQDVYALQIAVSVRRARGLLLSHNALAKNVDLLLLVMLLPSLVIPVQEMDIL